MMDIRWLKLRLKVLEQRLAKAPKGSLNWRSLKQAIKRHTEAIRKGE